MIYLIKPSWQEPEDENVIKSPRAGKYHSEIGKDTSAILYRISRIFWRYWKTSRNWFANSC